MDMDDGYQAAEGKRKKGYDDEVNGFSCKGSSTIQDGIVRAERGCTDCLFLLVFIAFVGSMGYLTFLGYTTGDVKKLLAPLDGDNRFCGVSEGVEDYPNLYITDFTSGDIGTIFDSAVCVKECPANGEDPIVCATSSKVDECKSHDQYSSTSVVGICMPTETPEAIVKGLKVLKDFIHNSAAGSYFNDLYLSSTSCYISIGMSVIYCLVYIYLMSWCAEPIAWFCVLLLQLFLLGSTGALWLYRESQIETRMKMYDDKTLEAGSEQEKTMMKTEKGLIVGTVLCGILAAGFFCCVCCGYKSLKLAIDVIDASADFLAKTKRILLVPGLFFIFQIITVVVWLGAMICVAAMNEIEASDTIPQGKDLEWTKRTTYMGLYMLFGVLWICAWFEYCSTFIVMVAASTYYFNSDASYEGDAEVGLGFSWAFNYHAGSIAIGAFIIAVIRFIRIVFVYLAQQAENASGDNQAVKLMVKVAECVLACIEKICDYLNESAYAYMAVSGENFCTSAWNGFLLNVKHILKFSFANLIAKVFILLGKVAITAGNIFSLYEIMKYRKDYPDEVSSLVAPMVLVGVVTFMTASIFLGLFDTAVLSLMTCLAIDMDLNDGTPAKGPPTFHDSVAKVEKSNSVQVEEEGGEAEDCYKQVL